MNRGDSDESAMQHVAIFIIAACFIWGLGLAASIVLLRRIRTASSWPRVTGSVLAANVRSTTDEEYFHVDLRYRFNVGSREHVGIATVPETFLVRRDAIARARAYPEETPIEVRYNPARPDESAVFVDREYFWKVIRGFAFCFFACCGSVVALFFVPPPSLAELLGLAALVAMFVFSIVLVVLRGFVIIRREKRRRMEDPSRMNHPDA
jgi:hypothetical protein